MEVGGIFDIILLLSLFWLSYETRGERTAHYTARATVAAGMVGGCAVEE